MTTEIQLNDGQTSTNREVFQDRSNVTSAQTSDTVAAQTADNAATFSREVVDDSLPECSHWSPRLVNQESAPYQTKDQPETSQAEQNESDQQTHSFKPTENSVCQEPETSQPANVCPHAITTTVAFLTSPKQLLPLSLTKKSSRVTKKRRKTAIITVVSLQIRIKVISQKKR
ncbi:unnamed protein product [Parnassius apollo]|uniref:(apollo) hypothetical protein n=1 Tax=Parnassius apollo TaxID=110799 RepID=A0A8S3W415_PARAO|nr:unnamed protein product [Parnassius apollo]